VVKKINEIARTKETAQISIDAVLNAKRNGKKKQRYFDGNVFKTSQNLTFK